MTGDYLKRKEQEGVYENVDKALEKVAWQHKPYYLRHGQERRAVHRQANIRRRHSKSKEAELYEGYIDVDYNNDGIMEHLIVHAVDDTPIRIQKNGF